MSRLSQRGQGAFFDLFQTSTDGSCDVLVGARFDSSDGREFVVVQNAGTALLSGNLIQGPAKIANHQTIAVVTFTAASVPNGTLAQVTATLGNTLTTLNQYALGYAVVNAGTGIGQTLKIASNSAVAGNAVVTIKFEDNPGVALDNTSKLCLHLNPYGSQNGTDFRTSGVIINPHAAATGSVVGVTLYPVAATTTTVLSYGLIQTKGIVACLNDANTNIGVDLMPSTNTDGAVMTYAAATGSRVGTSTQAGVTTESRLITIQL